jgi:hypothetical protein
MASLEPLIASTRRTSSLESRRNVSEGTDCLASLSSISAGHDNEVSEGIRNRGRMSAILSDSLVALTLGEPLQCISARPRCQIPGCGGHPVPNIGDCALSNYGHSWCADLHLRRPYSIAVQMDPGPAYGTRPYPGQSIPTVGMAELPRQIDEILNCPCPTSSAIQTWALHPRTVNR